MKSAEELAKIDVLDLAEETRPLGDAWAEGTVALVFIRHFG